MKLKYLSFIAASVCFALGAQAQQLKQQTLFVPRPGTLVELLTEAEANQITHLTLKGKINAIDFRHLRDEFHNLQQLDISNADISLYAGRQGTDSERFAIYAANVIPVNAFCWQVGDSSYIGKKSLRRIILSDKTRVIEGGAFRGCQNLRVCQIRRYSAPQRMEAALADSLTAIFVPTGAADAYREKKQWKDYAILEGEPLAVSVQIGLMSSLAAELQRKGIQPRDVNFLTVEGKLDNADFTLIRDYMPHLVNADLSRSKATAIPAYTFTQKRYLLNIALPSQLRSIGQRAFSGCTRLGGTLTLPPSVSAIEFGAFIGCDRLRQVVATGNRITTLGEQLFGEEENRLVYSSK